MPAIDEDLNAQLRRWADIYHVSSLDAHPDQAPKLVELGRFLFFDKELSGNRDVSCATCHQATFGSSDAVSLSMGTGGKGIGAQRTLRAGLQLHPRNSQDIFNRGASEWKSAFWDSRINEDPDGNFHTPAGDQTPPLRNVTALQALFPFTSRGEMRGFIGDTDVFGNHNELADFGDKDFNGIWAALMKRLMAIPKYRELFAAAYPAMKVDDMDFSLAGKAIAAFEIHDFAMVNDPWDCFLRGDNNAMTDSAKRGALVFMGEGRCIHCHSGNLLSDQEHYNILVPELGPGPDFNPEDTLDRGLFRLTKNPDDLFKYRTPPLRNVELTAPYMHNGAYVKLEDAVKHHFDCYDSCVNYDPSQLAPFLQPTVINNSTLLSKMMSTLAPELEQPIGLTDAQFNDLLEFLRALTDPAAVDMSRVRPDSLPSGLDMRDQ